MTRGLKLLILLLAVIAVGTGCGNYTSATRRARDEFYAGKYSDAAKALEKGAHTPGKNQLLYLLDRATALYQAGAYQDSIKDFHTADELAVINDYTSISRQAATLVTNDKIVPYKGEDFEKVLISQYLALDYLMLHRYEDALVECRRVNQKLYMMDSEGKRKYRFNPMARYLSALMYEDQRDWNDSYVDYQKTRDLRPNFAYIPDDLYRLAWRNGMTDEMQRWAKQYSISRDEQKQVLKTADKPEIVVIIENGKSPEKRPDPNWRALPEYVPRNNPVAYSEISINGVDYGPSRTLFDVESTAIEDLKEKYAGLIAKRLAGVATKEVVAHEVGSHTSPIFGDLLRLGMYAADQADLRSWLTLPKDFQIFRAHVLTGGSYTIKIQPRGADGQDVSSVSGAEKIIHFVDGQPGQRVFVPVRIL